MADYTAEIVMKNKKKFSEHAESILKKHNLNMPIDTDDVPEDILSEIFKFPFEFEQHSIR